MSLGIFVFVLSVLLFGNNAGWWRATEGSLFGLLLFFGWPVVIGGAAGGLIAWGQGDSRIGIALVLVGLIANIAYAIGFGILVRRFYR